MIKRNVPPFCAKCSRHLELYSEDSLCPSCREHPLAFNRSYGACLYAPPLDKLIQAFKYNGKTRLRNTFLNILEEFIETYHVHMENFDLIAPVPLHPVRLRERGYNQAQLIAEGLGQRYGRPVMADLLMRVKPTASQTHLTQKQRWTNLQGAFTINPSVEIADKNILLVDDLLTTKATANAAASVLKNHSAAIVSVITLGIT